MPRGLPIRFDPDNPFPLLSEGSHSYTDAQEHSACVDRWLGLETERIEKELLERRSRAPVVEGQHWIGLPVKSLLTPYTELRSILNELAPEPGSTVVDLGAGYGRMGFVVGRHFPGVRFLGYEIIPERVQEGRRCLVPWDYGDVELVQADLSSPEFRPVGAESYFIYDFGDRAAIEKTLQDLKSIATRRAIQVIGRGRGSRDAIERHHPWLAQVISPVHGPHHSVYRSA